MGYSSDVGNLVYNKPVKESNDKERCNMKLTQLIENFVISNDEFEDYLNRSTEQLKTELEGGKNTRDAVHDLALTFSSQHNKSYEAYERMSDSLMARMHTLELGQPATEVPAMDNPDMDAEAPSDMDMAPEEPAMDMETIKMQKKCPMNKKWQTMMQ